MTSRRPWPWPQGKRAILEGLGDIRQQNQQHWPWPLTFTTTKSYISNQGVHTINKVSFMFLLAEMGIIVCYTEISYFWRSPWPWSSCKVNQIRVNCKLKPYRLYTLYIWRRYVKYSWSYTETTKTPLIWPLWPWPLTFLNQNKFTLMVLPWYINPRYMKLIGWKM